MEIDGCFQGRQQLGVGEDVRSPMTPTKHMPSLGIFNDEIDEKNKEEAIGWTNKDVWV
jgi:hypothetical protein